jgi:hypothetical protein
MTILTSGNVGIGMTVPYARTQIHGAAADGNIGQLWLNTESNAADQGGEITFGSKYSSAYTPYAGIRGWHNVTSDSDVGGYMAFVTRPTGGSMVERMRILSTGNVGINTHIPQQLLEVNGAGGASVIRVAYDDNQNYFMDYEQTNIKMHRADGSGASMGFVSVNAGSWGSGNNVGGFDWRPDNSAKMILTRTGMLGLGTGATSAAVTAPLHIYYGDSPSRTYGTELLLHFTSQNDADNIGRITFRNTSANDLAYIQAFTNNAHTRGYMNIGVGGGGNVLVGENSVYTQIVGTYISLTASNMNYVPSGKFRLYDGVELELGTGADAFIRHTGSHMEITNTTGNLTIGATNGDMYLLPNGDSWDDVYIGDGNALCRVHLNGTGAYYGIDWSEGGSYKWAAWYHSADNKLYFRRNDSTDTNVMAFTDGSDEVTFYGTVKIAGGSPADGKVWTATDSNGTGNWEDAAGGGEEEVDVMVLSMMFG